MKKLLCSFLLVLGLVGQSSMQASVDLKASLIDAWQWAKPAAQVCAPVIFQALLKQGINIPDAAYAHFGIQAPKKTLFGKTWDWMKWGHAGLISGMQLWQFYGPAVMAAWNMMQDSRNLDQDSDDATLPSLRFEDLTAQEKQLFVQVADKQKQEQQALLQKIQTKMQQEGRALDAYTKAERAEMHKMHQKHLAERQELLKYIAHQRTQADQNTPVMPNVAPNPVAPIVQQPATQQPVVQQKSGATHLVAPVNRKRANLKRAVHCGRGCAC